MCYVSWLGSCDKEISQRFLYKHWHFRLEYHFRGVTTIKLKKNCYVICNFTTIFQCIWETFYYFIFYWTQSLLQKIELNCGSVFFYCHRVTDSFLWIGLWPKTNFYPYMREDRYCIRGQGNSNNTRHFLAFFGTPP